MSRSAVLMLVRGGLLLSLTLLVHGVWAKDQDEGRKNRRPRAGNTQPGAQNPSAPQFNVQPKKQDNAPKGPQSRKGSANTSGNAAPRQIAPSQPLKQPRDAGEGRNPHLAQRNNQKENKPRNTPPNIKPPGNTPPVIKRDNPPNVGPGNNNPNPGARKNNNPGGGNNNPNLGGQKNRPNVGGGNNAPGNPPKIVAPPQIGNKPGSNPNAGAVGGGAPAVKTSPRNAEFKNQIKEFPHDANKRQANEQNLLRNKDHAQEFLSKNPDLKNRVQGPNGQVDLSKLHMAHGNKDRIPSAVHKDGGLGFDPKSKPELSQRFNDLNKSRNLKDFDNRFRQFQDPGFIKQHPELAQVDWKHASGRFQNQLANNSLQNLAGSRVGNQLNLTRQFNLYQRGDVARQMNLNAAMMSHGGWGNRYMGPIYPGYRGNSFSFWYAGAGFYPRYCWLPMWSPWVDWSWWNTCPVYYDPRPFVARPFLYGPAPAWVAYPYPVWQPLPVVASGTWVDMPQTTVASGMDVQLVAVRFVDGGHPEQNLGSRYRVWVQNNSATAITSPFNILLLASNTQESAADLPQAGVTIPSMDPHELQAVDIRLPLDANRMNPVDGHQTPFSYLHVLVDSHRQLQDVNPANNGAVIARTEIFPVDPAAFAPDVNAAAPGALVSVAGEGFGPEPGRIIVNVNGTQTEATVYGWYDLGVQFELPAVPLTAPTEAEVLVVRGDGAASNPVTIQLAPEKQLAEFALPAAPQP